MGHTKTSRNVFATAFGSSPHTWGILAFGPLARLDDRFIPTYVGHTLLYLPMKSTVLGSSPHTWGMPILRVGVHGKGRFIPTYVGHANSWLKSSGVSSVHPHIRGACIRWSDTITGSCGSSPHTWGMLRGMTAAELARTVHPHIRGACIHKTFHIPWKLGSSPHTWGMQQRKVLELHTRRFIPTYVGHAACPVLGTSPCAVHPHIRGACISFSWLASPPFGSSPHTWGMRWP